MGVGVEGSSVFTRETDAVRVKRHARLVREAAFSLLHTRPEASAGNPAGLPLAIIFGPLTFLGVLALLDLQLAWLTICLTAGMAFLCLAGLRLTAIGLKPPFAPQRPLQGRELPTVTVIAALHREADSVDALVRALARFDYPSTRYEIALAVEADDEETLAAARRAARYALPALHVIPVPAIGPRTKPKALNYALKLTSGRLVAVYDAEDEPHPGQLRAAAQAFAADPGLGCVQAPLGWYNRTECWLTRMFALEYAAQFYVMLPLFARFGWPLPLGGTSNVFARAALADSGGWDPFNVTEDADLGFRLARQGWRCAMIEPGTLEEAPVTVKAWTAQRSRWLKGHALSWTVHMRRPGALRTEAGWGAIAALQASLGANVLSALFHAPAALLLAGIALHALAAGSTPWAAVPALAGYGAAILAAREGARRAGFRASWKDLLVLPVYWLLQFPAMARALHEIAGAPYFWAKTDHALTTRARTAPDEPHADAGLDGGHRDSLRPVRLAQRQTL